MKNTATIFGSLLVFGLWPLVFMPEASATEVAVPDFSGRPYDEHPILAPCTRFDDRYETLLFKDTYIEEWPEIYHDQVDRVVQEYLEPRELKCDAEDYETFLPPGGELLSLAAGLPTWNDPKMPLSEYDISRVLLEYLRVYECALMEFDEYLVYDTAVEQFSKPGITKLFFSGLMEQFLDRSAIINEERMVARVTLHRVLTLIGNFGRLRPLEAELECTQRLSIDIRNISALTAETSSCLPRIWNAKDALRDYKEEN